MKQHTLKTEPEYWEAQRRGDKTFEIRKNDRDFKVGDILILVYHDGESYPDKVLFRDVSYITDYAQKKGYVVMATKPRGFIV